MNPHNAGGGEILQYWGNGGHDRPSFLNDKLIQQFQYVPFVQILLYICILILLVYAVMKLFDIKSPFTRKGIKSQLNYIESLRKRDDRIIRANKFMSSLTEFIQNTPLSMDKANSDYWDYNIKRAGVRIPGGSRYMKANEFNAIVKVVALFSSAVSLLIMLFINSILGWVMLIATIVMASYCPMAFIRQSVKEKDLEISLNFCDYYLMLHYVLMENASTPLSSIMKSYDKTTTSEEMHRYIDDCIHNIDTYGEYEATRYIAKDYREIPEVNKLMRLIRQANEGGEIRAELIGFRDELIDKAEYNIRKRMKKIVKKARASFNILMPILVQAILSAMSIYMSDLGLAKGLMG